MLSFSQIPGLQELKGKLVYAAKKNKVSQTQLFVGPDGGSALALVLAYCKYLVCENPEHDACGNCISCKQWDNGNYPDVNFTFPFIKSGKSSGNEDCSPHINMFREFIVETPFRTIKSWQEKLESGNKQLIIPVTESQAIVRKLSKTSLGKGPRIFIIWLPEFFHTSAANRMLKSLEEPGPNTFFFLVTTAEQKLLSTIKSRCVRTKVPAYNEEEVRSFLIDQNLPIEDAASLALIAEGSLGFALYNMKDANLRAQFSSLFVQWVRAIYARDISALISFSDAFGSLGREDAKSFVRFSSGLFRQGYLLNNDQPVTPFMFEGFQMDRFSPFLKSDKMSAVLGEMESVRNCINRNANSRLLIFDASLKLFQYIG